MKAFNLISLISLIFLITFVNCNEEVPVEDPLEKPKDTEQESHSTSDQKEEVPTSSPEQNTEEVKDYKLGSLCNYCSYCKFCKLCDKDCPCETSKKRPNCHLCKYCKYCFLCSTCDVACTPGGMLDTISSAIYSSLPSFTKKEKQEVDKDIEKAKDWIKEYL